MSIKCLLFGGAFDPIHFGHLYKISEVLDILKYDRAIFIPTYKNMFGKKMAPGFARCAMIQKAINDFGDNRLKLSKFEIKHKLKANTFVVLTKLLQNVDLSKYKMSYVIGSDQAVLIHKWGNWEKLLQLLPFVVMTRSLNDKIPSVFFQHPHKVVKIKPVNISSTKIRQLIRSGDIPNNLLTKNTLKYIRENALYV